MDENGEEKVTNDQIGNSRSIRLAPESQLSPRSSKKIFLIIGVAVVAAIIVGAVILRSRITNLISGGQVKPSPSAASTILPSPSPSPSPLLRSEWSFEVLNGSGTSGLAKKIAVKMQDLGYQVVKIGNADRSDYSTTEILLQEDIMDKADLIIADLKDTIKIASMAGELKDSTASARIIIGKDQI